MQGCYTLLMLLYKVRSCCTSNHLSACHHLLGHPGPGSEIQNAERLVEELRHGLESIFLLIKKDGVFQHVGAMARDLEGALRAAFCS